MSTTDTAQARYWDAEEHLRIAHQALAEAGQPDQRARLLATLAAAQAEQAQAHPDAFGPDPLHDEDGRDLAESLASCALLYQLLADVEAAVAEPGRGRRVTRTDLEPLAGHVLDRMAATRDLTARVRLLEDLADAVRESIGAQAVETLWCLPSPGHCGWLSTAEKDAWWAQRGYGPRVASGGQALQRWTRRLAPWALAALVLAGAALTWHGLRTRQPVTAALGLILALGLPIRRARRRRRHRTFRAE